MPPRKRRQPRGETTPIRSFRPYPPEVWGEVKEIAKERGENVTDVLNRALVDYARRHRHTKQERPVPALIQEAP